MIHIFTITKELTIEKKETLSEAEHENVLWYWVDFESPTVKETAYLESFFQFHELAIEDCLQELQRPKLDIYDQHRFFVVQSIDKQTRNANEIDIFMNENFLVTYHKEPSKEIQDTLLELSRNDELRSEGPLGSLYAIIDNIVDCYFPIIYTIEDRLNDLDNNPKELSEDKIMEEIFDIRNELIHLRKTIIPMRDLLYRILHGNKIKGMKEYREYFQNIYDHLLKLSEMIESNREFTADMRENYISLNAYKMNSVMMTLTVITTIFMPLTFIAGIYGMNFRFMPELNTKYGYFSVLGVMSFLGLSMSFWFKKKGWFKK